ncbi:hypothetical protein NUSPORA_02945 [Nucleospora cyclopteri]
MISEPLKNIKSENIKTEKLCKLQLNVKTSIKSINNHSISVIKYHVCILKLESSDLTEVYHAIRQVLMENKLHLQPGNKERLYLSRNQIGRGFYNIKQKSKKMFFQFHSMLVK